MYMSLMIPSPTIIPIAYLIGLSIFGIVTIASIFILIAVKRISNAVDDREIFNNVLVWIMLQLVGIAIFFLCDPCLPLKLRNDSIQIIF